MNKDTIYASLTKNQKTLLEQYINNVSNKKTLAELSTKGKNEISHRSIAVNKLINFLFNGNFTDVATNHKLIKTEVLKKLNLIQYFDFVAGSDTFDFNK